MFRCARPVTACLARCHENVVHFSRCVTSFGDFSKSDLGPCNTRAVVRCRHGFGVALHDSVFFLICFFFATCVSITMSDSDRGG